MAAAWSCKSIPAPSRTGTEHRRFLRASRRRWTFVELAFADAGYAGDRVACASAIHIEIVRKPAEQLGFAVHKPAEQLGFAVHPRRWVVERFFAWLGRNRRLAKDIEASIASAQAFLYAASVMLLLRRLARSA
jgi:putative transposase